MKFLLFLLLFCQAFCNEWDEGGFSLPSECDEGTEEPVKIVLTLRDAINRALTSNRQIVGSQESFQKVQLNLEFAESDFDWHITPRGSAGYIGGGSAGSGGTVGGGIDFTKKFTNGTRFEYSPSILKDAKHFHTLLYFKVSQPLLRGWGSEYTMSGLRGAEFAYRSSVRSVYQTQVSTILRTINAMYEIVKQEKTMKLNQESYDRLAKLATAVKMKEKIGLADGLDVYRVEAELRQAEDALTSSIERYQEALDMLRDILAYPLETPLEINLPIQYHEIDIPVQDALEKAYRNRIELDQSQDQLSESLRLSKVAERNLLPDLKFVVDFTNTGREESFTDSCFWHKRESKWGIGFQTSGDFEMEAEKIAFSQSMIGVSAAERSMDQTRDNITLEVKRVLRQLQRIAKRIHLQEEQIKNSQGELYLSKIKFDRGMANNFDVIQAEKSLRNAENSLINAVIDHILGEFQLHAALGLLLEKPPFF